MHRINKKIHFSLLNTFNKLYFKNISSKTELNELESIRDKLTKLSLLNVEKYGWTDLSIKTAANELGYSNSLAAVLPGGPIDLIYFTMDSWNDKLKSDLNSIKSQKHLSTNEKFQKAIKLRLSYEIPLMNTWPQAIKLGMHPSNIKSTLNRLLTMTDEICSNLEETPERNSSLFKRYLILKIFMLSELYLLTDKSFNNQSTWDFLNKVYNFNFGIYSALNNFTMVNSAVLNLIKYSLIAFAPYDFSQVDEILKLQQEELEKSEDFTNKLNNSL